MSLIGLKSVLTRPNDTTAYAQNDLIASSTTAGSIVVPQLVLPRLGLNSLRALALYSSLTTGGSAATFLIELWDAAPTFTNGDNGAYAVATGAANWLWSFTVGAFNQVGDGCYGMGAPSGSPAPIAIDLANNSLSLLFWSLKLTNAAGFTPQANQTFTIAPVLA